MRDILFRNLTSQDKRRKELILSEVSEKDGVMTKIVRKSAYNIKFEDRVKNPLDIDELVANSIENEPQNLRHFYILKRFDSRNEEEEFIYKIVGKIYAITGENIFSVEFTHSLKIVLIHNFNSNKTN